MRRRLVQALIGLAILALVIVVVVGAIVLPLRLAKPGGPPKGVIPKLPVPGPNWTLLNSTPSPSTTSGMMAYAPLTGEVILLDSEGSCDRSYTWAFSGGAWENITDQVSPGPEPARALGGLVYDAAEGYMVLFGGSSPCGVYNDTWIFENDSWTHLLTPTAPPPLYGFAMTYDASDGYVLLTGGCCIGGKDSHETWQFQDGTWTNLTNAPTPIVDLDSGLTFDSSLGEVVFVGGYASGYVSQATWVYHNATWLRLYPAVSPSNRAGMGLAYDAALGKDVLVGGYAKVTKGVWINLTDTWTYGDGKWQNLTNGLARSPPFVSGPTLMTYDIARHQLVLFLGFDETWLFG